MPLIVFSALSPDNKQQEHSFAHEKMNLCLEMMNYLVANHWQLFSAVLFVEQTRTPLPVAAFDGESILHSLQELEVEWEVALMETR